MNGREDVVRLTGSEGQHQRAKPGRVTMTCQSPYAHHIRSMRGRWHDIVTFDFCDGLFDRIGWAEMKPSGPSGNQSTMWSDEAFEATEFMFADYRDFVFPPHVHETFGIGVIEAGGQQFRPGRAPSLIMPANTLCVFNPGLVHEGRPATEQGWRYRMFYPSPTLVARILEPPQHRTVGGEWGFGRHVIDDPELYREFENLHVHHSVERPCWNVRRAPLSFFGDCSRAMAIFRPKETRRPLHLARWRSFVTTFKPRLKARSASSTSRRRPASPARRSSGPSQQRLACRRMPTWLACG